MKNNKTSLAVNACLLMILAACNVRHNQYKIKCTVKSIALNFPIPRRRTG